jgi:hypothetical protein
VRRFVLVVLSSAILLSACSSKGFPGAGGTANSAASTAPTAAATVAATPAAVIVTTPTPKASVEAPATPVSGSDWVSVTPVGAGFTAKFPGAPTQSSQSFSTAVGDAPASLWIFEQSNDLAFFVVEARYPSGSMTGVSTSAVYDGAVKGMTGSSAGLTVDSQDNVTLGGHDGRSFTLTSTAASIKGQMYLIGDNLYMIYAAYTANADPSVIDEFISYFTLSV